MNRISIRSFLSTSITLAIFTANFENFSAFAAPIITQPVITNGPVPEGTVIAPELQEPGVFYIHNQMSTPVQGKVEAITTAYTHRTFLTAAGTLVPGQIIEIIAIAPEGFLVRPLVRGNNFIGWIRKEQLPPGVDKDLLAQAEELYQHQQDIGVAIANKNVIQGMTPDEVQQAIGKPTQVTRNVSAQGNFETWTYTTYKQVPQNAYALDASGNPVPQTSYVSVPIGTLTVNFDDGLVVAVQEVRTDPESPGVYQAPGPAPQPTSPPVADYSAPQYQQAPQVYTGDQGGTVTYYQAQGPVYYPVWGGYGYRGERRAPIIINRNYVPANGNQTRH